MKKYLSIFKMSLKQEKETLMDSLFRGATHFVIMFVLIELWRYIYGNGTNEIINGYSISQMIWYLLISECLYSCMRSSLIIRNISNEVKSGSIAYKLNKPYNYYLYNIVTYYAKSLFLFLIILPISIILGLCFIGLPSQFHFYQIFPWLLTVLLSFTIGWAFYSLIGLLSFWVEDATPFNWIALKFFLLFGILFPIDFFPTSIQPIIRYSPIYTIFSGPSSLLANYSFNDFLSLIFWQIFYILLIIFLGLGVYKLGKRKVVSNGG